LALASLLLTRTACGPPRWGDQRWAPPPRLRTTAVPTRRPNLRGVVKCYRRSGSLGRRSRPIRDPSRPDVPPAGLGNPRIAAGGTREANSLAISMACSKSLVSAARIFRKHSRINRLAAQRHRGNCRESRPTPSENPLDLSDIGGLDTTLGDIASSTPHRRTGGPPGKTFAGRATHRSAPPRQYSMPKVAGSTGQGHEEAGLVPSPPFSTSPSPNPTDRGLGGSFPATSAPSATRLWRRGRRPHSSGIPALRRPAK
jgi:hypothetical protein